MHVASLPGAILAALQRQDTEQSQVPPSLLQMTTTDPIAAAGAVPEEEAPAPAVKPAFLIPQQMS